MRLSDSRTLVAGMFLLLRAPAGKVGAMLRTATTLVLLLTGPTLRLSAQSTATASPVKEAPWTRIAVAGASLTWGFGVRKELGADVPFSTFLDLLLRKPHEPVRPYGGPNWYRKPVESGASALLKAHEDGATMLVALDFPFWFGYASAPDEKTRHDRVRRALAMLDRWMKHHDGPVVVGTLPSLAPRRPLEYILNAIISPEPETLEAINATIRVWAKPRPRVVLIPLAEWIAKVRAGESLDVGPVTWPADSADVLLQDDRLHPTVEGLCGVAAATLHAVSRRFEEIPESSFDYDARALAEKLRRLAARARKAREGK